MYKATAQASFLTVAPERPKSKAAKSEIRFLTGGSGLWQVFVQVVCTPVLVEL